MNIRSLILLIFYPFLRILSNVKWRYATQGINLNDVEEIRKIVKRGDIVLTKTKGEFTNLIIPGKYKHAAIYAGDKYEYSNKTIIEAIHPKVKKIKLSAFLWSKDKITILRPKTIDQTEIHSFLYYASLFIGKKYDYNFYLPETTKNNKAFYCAELVFWCLQKASDKIKLKTKKVMGVQTITADDFLNDRDNFDIVWSNNEA